MHESTTWFCFRLNGNLQALRLAIAHSDHFFTMFSSFHVFVKFARLGELSWRWNWSYVKQWYGRACYQYHSSPQPRTPQFPKSADILSIEQFLTWIVIQHSMCGIPKYQLCISEHILCYAVVGFEQTVGAQAYTDDRKTNAKGPDVYNNDGYLNKRLDDPLQTRAWHPCKYQPYHLTIQMPYTFHQSSFLLIRRDYQMHFFSYVYLTYFSITATTLKLSSLTFTLKSFLEILTIFLSNLSSILARVMSDSVILPQSLISLMGHFNDSESNYLKWKVSSDLAQSASLATPTMDDIISDIFTTVSFPSWIPHPTYSTLKLSSSSATL